MEDLIAWLRACLDDDEKAAKAATPGPWRHSPDKHWHRPGTPEFEESVFAGPAGDAATSVAGTGPSDDPQSMADAAHIARHDPAAVLADVEAKRAVLDATVGEIDRYGTMPPEAHIMADEVVKALASAYRHRPGWRTEWE